MGVAFFGLNSIVTLSAIACERYIVITSSSCRPVVAKWRITRRQAQKVRIFRHSRVRSGSFWTRKPKDRSELCNALTKEGEGRPGKECKSNEPMFNM